MSSPKQTTAVPSSTTPRSLPPIPDLRDGSTRLLLCLDFDGTLTPIAASPDEPTITDRNYRAVQSLSAHPQTQVAIISGRAIPDLKPRVGVSGITYAGNHGLELCERGHRVTHPGAAAQIPVIQRLITDLRAALSETEGTFVENKRLSATVHYRQAAPDQKPAIRHLVKSVITTETAPVRLVSGKESIEIRPAVEWDKGTAVGSLESRLSGDCQTVYIGDDTTDEDAFDVLGPDDIDVFVGTGPTTATYRLSTPQAVASFLDWIDDSLTRDPGRR